MWLAVRSPKSDFGEAARAVRHDARAAVCPRVPTHPQGRCCYFPLSALMTLGSGELTAVIKYIQRISASRL